VRLANVPVMLVVLCVFSRICAFAAGTLNGEVTNAATKQEGVLPLRIRETMNPLFLRTCAVMLSGNKKERVALIADLNAQMAAEQETQADCVNALLMIYAAIKDVDASAWLLARLCVSDPALGVQDSRCAKIVERRLREAARESPQFLEQVLVKAINRIPPGPNAIYAQLISMYISRPAMSYAQRAAFMQRIVATSWEKMKAVDPADPMYSNQMSAMSELSYVSACNHYGAMQIVSLRQECQDYLKKFGAQSRHSGDIYYFMLRALNYTKKIGNFDMMVRQGLIRDPHSPYWTQKYWYREWKAGRVDREGTSPLPIALKIEREWKTFAEANPDERRK